MAVTFQRVAAISEIPRGQSRIFEVDGKSVSVCNVEGEIFAIADLCSHDDGPLGEGELTDHQIECPRHGARFDLKTGKALCLPAVLPIPVYKVELRGEEIWIGDSEG